MTAAVHRIAVAGGGTGGHVTPALALASWRAALAARFSSALCSR